MSGLGVEGLGFRVGGGPPGERKVRIERQSPRTRRALEGLAWHWSHLPGRLVNRGGGVSLQSVAGVHTTVKRERERVRSREGVSSRGNREKGGRGEIS